MRFLENVDKYCKWVFATQHLANHILQGSILERSILQYPYLQRSILQHSILLSSFLEHLFKYF